MLGIIHGVQVLWSLFQTSLFVRRETLCRPSHLAYWLVQWSYCSISELTRLPHLTKKKKKKRTRLPQLGIGWCLSKTYTRSYLSKKRLTPGVSSFSFLFSFLFLIEHGMLYVFSVVLHYHLLVHGIISSNVICDSDEILGAFLHG